VKSVEVYDGSPLVYWRGSYLTLPSPPEIRDCNERKEGNHESTE